jgi:hypothetical protein
MELASPAVAGPLFVGCSLLVALAVPRMFATADAPVHARDTVVRPLDYTAEQVLDDGIAASGGRERLSQLVATRTTGSVRDLTNGAPVQQWHACRTRPGNFDYEDSSYQMIVRADADGGRELEYQNGSWHSITGGELDDDLLDARFDHDLRWRELFRAPRLLGVVDFDGQPAYAVELVSHRGRARTRFFSVTSHLEIGYEELLTIGDRHHDDAADVPASFTFRVAYSDFRNVNGLVLPFHSIRHAAGGYFDELERTWDSYELEFEHAAP